MDTKKCEYCQNGRYIIDDDDNELWITKDNGRPVITMDGSCGIVSRQINYCPMCGRKLEV